jgi:hypothetical protein
MKMELYYWWKYAGLNLQPSWDVIRKAQRYILLEFEKDSYVTFFTAL